MVLNKIIMGNSKLKLEQGKLYIIEITDSERKKILKFINLKPIGYWAKRKHTILSFIQEKSEMEDIDLNLFMNDLDNTGVINLKTRLSELPDPYLVLLQLKCISKVSEKKELIISDAGMHYYNLKLFYKTLNELLEKGNTCLVFSYSSFDSIIVKEFFSDGQIIILDKTELLRKSGWQGILNIIQCKLKIKKKSSTSIFRSFKKNHWLWSY
ncbi:hypothetical protein [Tenacibaculum maritimum]|uniref:hypothetical protein n=1 Tax=Tenacibaculum maritimum TaxID=107401 RepID=UPI003875BC63